MTETNLCILQQIIVAAFGAGISIVEISRAMPGHTPEYIETAIRAALREQS